MKKFLVLVVLMMSIVIVSCKRESLPDSAYPSRESKNSSVIENSNSENEEEMEFPEYYENVVDINGTLISYEADVKYVDLENEIVLGLNEVALESISNSYENDYFINEYGNIHLFNSDYDINGNGEDIYHIFEDGYITSIIPIGMNETAIEVANRLSDDFEQYSCLTFNPITVLAFDDSLNNQGYYEITYETYMNNVPIIHYSYVDTDSNSVFTGFSVCTRVSGNGIFDLIGNIPYQEEQEIPINNNLSFEQLISNFERDICYLFDGDSIVVVNIYTAYMPVLNSDGNYHLVPVLALNCIGESSNDNEIFESSFVIVYEMETCDLFGLMY